MTPLLTKPVCVIPNALSWWAVVCRVNRILKSSGKPGAAHEFRTRALILPQDDDDVTELLALATTYVELEPE